MKQIKITTILLSICSMGELAQQLEVVSSSGGFLENSSGSISFTLGECVISTLSSPNSFLTQGFHQTFLSIQPGISDIRELDFDIAVFPNPVKDLMSLQVKKPRDFYYVLYDINGAVLEQKEIVTTESDISFENLSPAVYILKVFKGSQEVKIFKIIKQ